MDRKDLGELLRLMDQAKRSGVLEQLLQSMVVSVSEVPSGSMTDAAKRRKDVREELVVHSESHPDSDWDEVDNPTKDDPTVDGKARYETEGNEMVAKPLAAPSTEDVKHVDKTVKLPVGVKRFEVWGRTIIKMDKYAKNKWSFAELVALSNVDRKAMHYTRRLIGKFATPPLIDPQNQAEDYGTFARACGIQPAKAGYQRSMK